MGALGGSLTIFFPMTTAWLRQRHAWKSELNFYDELFVRRYRPVESDIDVKPSPILFEKVNPALPIGRQLRV